MIDQILERLERLIRDRRLKRLTLGLGAILPLSEAAAMAPMDDREAKAWMLREGLVRDWCGRKVVRWHDVWSRLGEEDAQQTPEEETQRRVVLLGERAGF